MATLSLTVSSDKSTYYLRQKITVSGNLTSDSSPIGTALVAVEIKDPRDNPFYFRTIPIGNPSETWAIEVTDFKVTDLSANPLTKVTLNSQVSANATIRNKLLNPLDVVTTITICDETLIPIYSGWSETTVEGGDYAPSSWAVTIPEWTKPGKALVFINVYTSLPENQGVPYAPETLTYFYMVRNPECEPAYAQPITTFNSSTGKYAAYLNAPPDRYTRPGTYAIYAVGRISPAVKTYNTATFSLNTYPTPPQAAFTYSPLQIYQNMTVTFDASSSSAEGFNDTIIRYDWTINDPSNPQHTIKTGNYTNPPDPTVTHTFQNAGTFVTTLNVTDNEGLWSTTSKPIIVMPEFGPTANFTWSPQPGVINLTMTFDASNSKTGWSAATQQFSPIVNYTWNFGDGIINQTSNAVIFHIYTQPGNYTVALTVKDAVGRTDMTSRIVEVANITVKQCDVNGDGFIDIKDILITALAYGSVPGDPRWNPRADVNGDGFIDIKDILLVALNYGQDP
jgi:PKD repeat protein